MTAIATFDEDYRRLRDEVEELRMKGDEQKKLEASIENYRNKLSQFHRSSRHE